MTILNKLAITVAATLFWGASATLAQIPSGTYSNTFNGTAALYDPTGDHTQAIGGLRVEFTLNMDEKGKLTGGGTAFFSNGTTNDVSGTADVTCLGAMKSFKGVSRARFTLKIKGTGGNGIIKENLDPDPSNHQMTGTATGTISTGTGKGSKQKLASTPVNLNLPIGADGSWTLEMSIAPSGNKYTGSGIAAICGCKTYDLTVSGTTSRQGTSKLILKGGKAVKLTLTASAAADGVLQVQTMNGKMLGQAPRILHGSQQAVWTNCSVVQAADPARWAWIPPGTFVMGSPDTEYDRTADESPQTTVTLTHGFWMERFEVTQSEYVSLMGTNPATFTSDLNQPVEGVSWFDATNYCGRLTAQEQAAGRLPAGNVYRLATEAEWEYATRAGTTNRFFFGDDLTYTLLLDYAWVPPNSSATTHDVGSKLPNQWGLYDTSGNLWEWCADWYGPYLGGSLTDPTGPPTGTSRVMRGGSWLYPPGDARSATRAYNVPEFLSHGIGIRVVLGPILP